MENLTDTKQVIILLKQVKEEKNLSLDKIMELIAENGDFVSKTTLSRLFREGSENESSSFRYETTIRPVCNALLDIEHIEVDDDVDTQAYKSLLKLKKDLLTEYVNQNKELKEELKAVKEKERSKYNRKLEEHTERFQRTTDFLSNQILLKDQRIDVLLSATTELMATNNKLFQQLMEVSYGNDTV